MFDWSLDPALYRGKVLDRGLCYRRYIMGIVNGYATDMKTLKKVGKEMVGTDVKEDYQVIGKIDSTYIDGNNLMGRVILNNGDCFNVVLLKKKDK
jgi:hypothetical protein